MELSKQGKSATWSQMLLAVCGLVCVTVLAVLHDIGGEIALVAIVSVLGAGGVNTVLTVVSGFHAGAGAAQAPADPPAKA